MLSRIREFFAAGRLAWNTLVAVSCLICLFNPVGAVGISAYGMTFKTIYGTPEGWALTAASFMIGMTGLIISERIAYVDRNRRMLEIAGLVALMPAAIAFAAGLVAPAVVMWPISAMFLIVGVSGLRIAGNIPDIGFDDPAASQSAEAVAESTTAPFKGRRRLSRKQRRRKQSSRSSRSGS